MCTDILSDLKPKIKIKKTQNPGWHSDQGSQFSGIPSWIGLCKNNSGERARLFAQNFDARLAGIVIWLDCPLFEKKSRGTSNPWKSTQLTIYVFKNPVARFSEGVEAPQAAATQTHRAGRPLGHDGTLQIYNKLENKMFFKNWNLTCKDRVKSHASPEN